MFSKRRKTNLISIIYVLVFYYNILLNFLTFRPVITNIAENEYENTELFYFPNENCAYLWKSSNPLSNKILFYVNSFEGNCSTRFNILKGVQNLIDNDYDIIHFDLSGFGLSNKGECNLTVIQLSLLENINYVMEKYANSSNYSILTENESIIPISKILDDLVIKPQSLICLNAKNSIFDYMKLRYTSYLIPFYFSYYFDKSVSFFLEKYYEKYPSKTKFFFLKNDELQDHDDYDVYFEIDTIPIQNKKTLTIQGKGPTSFILHENNSVLEKFFQQI